MSDSPSAAERAYEATKELILDGVAAPGQMLSEGEIAARLGLSRTPVREAFLRLQSEGWLRLYPKRGALVVPPDPHEARDVLDARVVIESAAVEAICADDDVVEAVLPSLDALLVRQERALADADLPTFTEADVAFHRTLVAAGANAVLLRVQDELADRERRMSTRSLWRRPASAEAALAQHRTLREAVAGRDVARFRETLREHLVSTHHEQLDA